MPLLVAEKAPHYSSAVYVSSAHWEDDHLKTVWHQAARSLFMENICKDLYF